MAIINGTFLPDILTGTDDDDVINGGGGLDILSGGDGNDQLNGGAGDDILHGDAGNDVLDSGAAGTVSLASILDGGSGDDLLIASSGSLLENFNGGDGIDTLSLVNRPGAQTIALDVGLLDIPLVTDSIQNVENVIGSNFDDAIYGDSNANALSGGTGNDTLSGMGGNDVLDGGIGADTMTGGVGDDTYYIDNAGDVINEVDGEGNDTVYLATSYELGDDSSIERVIFTGNGDFDFIGNASNNNITGNAGDNRLEGRDGNDRLDGAAGADTMVGGQGNDHYFVDNPDDVVVENPDEGNDTVESSISYAIADDQSIENLILTGNADLNATGNSHVNYLYGNGGDNLIDGREAGDRMEGRGGDDTYIVDNVFDVVIENIDEGYDIVRSSVSYSIAGQYIEQLDLTGSDDIGGRGNSLSNIINGNDGANRLNGDTGADVMTGHLGNDRYVVDNIGDVVIENANEGTDFVESYIDYTLGTNVEVLRLIGTAAIDGTGNAADNEIDGNNAANVINGGAGADLMRGFGGSDHYTVDNAGDVVLEAANQGYDVVDSSVSFSVAGQYVEELHLTGTASINGTGNSLANLITGNDGANTLRGMAGDDKLHGGFGNDTLQGGDGNDGYYFDTALSAASNVDRILDFNVADDTVYLDSAIFDALGAPGTLAASAFTTGTGAHDADDHIIYNSATGALYYDSDGTGSAAAVQFAQIGTGLALTASDFVVV